jgi:glycosyltransferase involved in cell wall biosynthesis
MNSSHSLRRLAILAPGYGITPRGIESVVAELSMRLCSQWHIDIYTMGPASTGNPACIHVPGIRSTSQLALWYARLGHRLRRWWKLRSPIDFQSLTYSVNLLPRILRQTYSAILNLSGPFGGFVCQLKRNLDGTPFIHSSQGQSIGWLELMHADQHPDYFFALTQPGFDWICRERPALRTALVPNGVDVERYHPDVPPVTLNLPRPIFLFVGALTPMKRPDLAIEAVASLERGSLVMIGDGEQRKQIVEQGVKRLGKDRFLHIPFIAQEFMPAHYAACDVFTLPSPDEPFGVVFLEAMACNKPVVAHHGRVQKWLVGHAGNLCDCAMLGAYSVALERATLSEWNMKPRSRAVHFSWDLIADQYHTYLETLDK